MKCQGETVALSPTLPKGGAFCFALNALMLVSSLIREKGKYSTVGIVCSI